MHAASPPAAVPIPGASATPAFPSPGETRTVERAVEARTGDDSMASMVRTLYFADTFVVNGGFAAAIGSVQHVFSRSVVVGMVYVRCTC